MTVVLSISRFKGVLMIKKIDGITVEELHRSYRNAAMIVSRYGDAYLPIFKRLHSEVEKLKAQDEIKSLALSVASGITGIDETD